ncbi:CAP domain-containing protein [Microbulbifer marinus]|uniref:Cysteine-rich secretory protein family protein n=1 Tax=Microbulbifer marinus TaxID=658218 RepID=A0A1H3ZBP4_9GAMM|nr:CAP domain-containing protein [Microbulbifer marinus]SEA20938.1 Cysteine-rich secretory protein family protein [Microbulbifer marinus]
MNQSLITLLLAIAVTIAAQAGAAAPDCTRAGKCKALDLHNQVRKKLNAGRLPNSPKPNPPVAMLKYDKALARTAYNWSAAQCNSRPGHNGKRREHFIANGGNPAYPSIGENIFYSSAHLAETDALSQAVAGWAGEAAQYRYRPFKDLKTGHYSQLIWDSMNAFDAKGRKLPRAVGCGVYHCPRGNFRTIVTCNYAPAGNIYKHLPYRTD